MNGRVLELIETIIKRDLPDEFSATYASKPMTNTLKTSFIDLGEGRTRYQAEAEYVEMNGFMVKLMAKLFPGMFKKQVQKWMDQFRDFAESK